MARKALERVSQREYARRLGLSNEAVSKAIREGKISKGWDKKREQIIVEHADVEWGALHMKTNVSKLVNSEPGHEEPDSRGGLTLTGSSSFAEAKRVREIIGAQLSALDLKERKGELVKKDDVYKTLYKFGQEVRVSLMAIPDRSIDSIRAAKTRAEAHQILTAAIHSALDALTKTDFEISSR